MVGEKLWSIIVEYTSLVWQLMQCTLSDEGRGMLLSYRPCMANESEVNAAGKLDTRSESRERAFDHHDMLDI